MRGSLYQLCANHRLCYLTCKGYAPREHGHREVRETFMLFRRINCGSSIRQMVAASFRALITSAQDSIRRFQGSTSAQTETPTIFLEILKKPAQYPEGAQDRYTRTMLSGACFFYEACKIPEGNTVVDDISSLQNPEVLNTADGILDRKS